MVDPIKISIKTEKVAIEIKARRRFPGGSFSASRSKAGCTLKRTFSAPCRIIWNKLPKAVFEKGILDVIIPYNPVNENMELINFVKTCIIG
jgi:HSP20 family molecular chaperone IbpA